MYCNGRHTRPWACNGNGPRPIGSKGFAPGHIAEDIPNLEESARKLGNNDGAIHPLVVDLRKPTDCEFVIDSALKKYGKVEVLINNAGLGMRPFSENFMTDPVKFWETDVNQVKATFDTNALGPFQMARAAILTCSKVTGGAS